MALTSAQQTTLKAAIEGDVTLNAFPNTLDGAFAIAALLNQTASPDFWVWRTNIPTKDAKNAVVWTEYISSTSQAERDAWRFMLDNGILNAADPNIRQGVSDIFSGPQKVTTRTNLLAIARRLATRAEQILATGTGSTASPATMSFEGNLSFQDVFDARNS